MQKTTKVLVEVTKSAYVEVPVPCASDGTIDIDAISAKLRDLVEQGRIDLNQMDLSHIQWNDEDATFGEWEEINFAPRNGHWPDVSVPTASNGEGPWKLDLTVTAQIQNGHSLSVGDIKDELAKRLLSCDDGQHLECMNFEPDTDVTFTVAGTLPEN